MLTKLHIKGRVLLLTLLPSAIFAIVLGSWFGYSQINDAQQQLLRRGELILNQVALLSLAPMQSKDLPHLMRIAQDTIDLNDVRSIRFTAADGTVLLHSGPSMSKALTTTPLQLTVHSHESISQLSQPVCRNPNIPVEPEQLSNPDLEPIGWVSLEMSHHATLLDSYRTVFFISLLIMLGLSATALLALRLSRAIHAPLEQIKKGVASIRDGHLSTRLESMGSQELEELADDINQMAQALQHAQEGLQGNIDQALADAQHNLETIEIQNVELDFARKEAVEASRIKSEFLANMSHEIRTPLNGIIGFTQLLKKTDLTARQKDYLNTIIDSSENLLNIINETLDFSKIEAGKLILNHAPFYVRDLIQDTLTLLAPAAHQKQLELINLVYSDTPQTLIGDVQHLKQILTNLIGNAIKFTREGNVVIRTMLEEDDDEYAKIRFSIQDTGIGVHEDEQALVFQAFSQADHSLTRETGGTGLGLAISKRLVEHMDGEIGVNSIPDQGSEFWFSVRLAKTANSDSLETPHTVFEYSALLYEPHPLAQQSITHQLNDCGVQVEHTNHFETIVEQARQAQENNNAYDLVVLSISTAQHQLAPLKHILNALQQLKCKILLVSSTRDFTLFQDNLGRPFCEHMLSKPVCHRRLKHSIATLLHTRTLAPSPTPIPSAIEPARLGPTTLNALCVDDNPANLLLIKTLLSDMGLQVSVAENGYTALTLFQQQRFAIVFMDIQMPVMSGQECAEAIREWEHQQQRSATPIIAVTAHVMPHEASLFMQSGINDCLSKPISEHSLAQAIAKWIGVLVNTQETLVRTQDNSVAHQQLAVLDQHEGRSLSNGKESLANELLQLLLDSLPGDRAFIQQARSRNDRNALLERIHRMHGAAQYCGVPQLRAICKTCETLIKSNSEQIEPALDELDSAIERLLLALQAHIHPHSD